MRSTRALAGVALGCLPLLAACGGTTGAPAAQPGQLTVVTAVYPLQFVAERVAGDHAAVTSLTSPGAEPHDVELTPRQVASLSDADAVVYIEGFQPAVDEAVGQSGNAQVLNTNTVVPLQTLVEEHDHDHADEAPTEEDEHGHDHGGLDPHVWLNPLHMITITEAVADRLAQIDPEHAADYQANSSGLVSELERLDAAYASGLDSCERREFITSHTAFGYLAEQYDLTQIGIRGLSPDAEPSAARIAEIQRDATAHKVTTIFYETLVSPAVSEAVAGDLGLQTDVLDPVEAITPESRGDNYIAVMGSNLAALRKANGCR